jgi:C-terminal processing protease CtpA/Prc
VYLGQPVVLLTSRLTGSGAEIFTMAMRDLPQVTVMGENTGGGLSDILGVSLPNGWKFGLSNQEYATSDGSIYEATGIPPEIVITIDPDALARGEDPVLQAAISKLLNSGN